MHSLSGISSGRRVEVPASTIAIGLWFRLAVVGSFMAVLAIVLLATGTNVAVALAVLLAGGALAWFAARRTRTLLEDGDDVPATPPAPLPSMPSLLRGTGRTLQRG